MRNRIARARWAAKLNPGKKTAPTSGRNFLPSSFPVHTLSCLLLLFNAASAGAQEIAKGTFRIGEWCEYQIEATPPRKERLEIVETFPDGGYAQKRSSDGEVRVYDAEGRLVRAGNREYKPPLAGVPFPIKAGEKGRTSRSTAPHARRVGEMVNFETQVRAVEPERVAVPAGTFETLRVDLRTNYSRSGYSNYEERSLSYPLDRPAKFPVKITYVDHGTPRSDETWSLLSCNVLE